MTLDYDPFASLHEDQEPTTWAAMDVGAVLRGELLEQPPQLLTRSDDVSLIYAGKVHALNSESEAGKTWVALLACSQEMTKGCPVVYVDFEDSIGSVVGRLMDMRIDPKAVEAMFHYVRPDEPLSGAAVGQFAELLAEVRPTLTVIDGVTEAMVMNGWSIKDNDDTARFMERVTRPIARTGSAVLVLDHVTKDREGRGRHAIGAQHKLSGVDGAVYSMTASTAFGRGKAGSSQLKVMKDRPGWVRPEASGSDAIATVQFVGSDDGAMEVRLVPPGRPPAGSAAEESGDPEVITLVGHAVEEAGDWIGTNEVRRSVPKKKMAVTLALSYLADTGYVEHRQRGQAVQYRHVRRYVAGEDT